MYNILVCDDDKEIVKAIEIYLAKECYNVFKAYYWNEFLEILQKNKVQLVILDIMMQKKDGIETIHEIREKYSIPVIMLSAKSEDEDKIKGLDMGADDYVTKPFNPQELIARVNSLLRRYTKLGSAVEAEEENIFRVGDLEIDDNLKQVKINDQEIKLTPTEYKILKFLTENKGKEYSINQIYENIWAEDCYGAENIIAVHIRHIREKIEINPKEPKYLKVIWGVGYKIEKDV